ncbi:hypothetical protein [Paenibacillus polymyxa]|uniref:hypothetical protein n=1 Tax=Paenibacillus polymyxa TaxID=1406 RepID=UPI002377DB43|nr:hypothetical protein [Paenibacillus polymyxa]WDM22294.1 hypothetical protein J4I02_01070 [Paenibacillus polymyxa]
MEEVYEYFVHELGMNEKIHKYIPAKKWLMKAGLLVAIIFEISSLFFISTWYISISLMVLGIVAFFVFTYCYYKSIEKVLLDKYNAKLTDKFPLSSIDYYNYINGELAVYLQSKDLHTEKKLELLIDRFKKKADETPGRRFFIPGIFAALTLPVWNQTAISLFKNINNTQQIVTLFSVLFFIIATMTFIASYYISFFKLIFGLKNQRYRLLIGHLEDIYIKLL